MFNTNNKISILVLSNLFPSKENSSSGVFVMEQLLQLQRDGIEVRVISGKPCWINRAFLKEMMKFKSPLSNDLHWQNVNGLQTIYFSYPAPYSPLWERLAPFFYIYGLKKILPYVINTYRFYLLHAHTSYLDGYAAYFMSKKYQKPFVITEHTGPFTSIVGNIVSKKIVSIAINKASELISVSHFLANEINQYVRHDKNIKVIANGVDPTIFKLNENINYNNNINVLWVGSFVDVKQPLLMLEAFINAHNVLNNMRLLMVGDGCLKDSAIELIARHGMQSYITISNSVDRLELSKIYNKSDFLAVTSKVETFSLVVIESLACGKPVLSTRCGGPEEIISNVKGCLLVDNTLQGLQDGLISMSKTCNKNIASYLRNYAVNNYSYSNISPKLLSIYKNYIKLDV